MHVISIKPLREFWEKYPQSQDPLKAWYDEAKKAKWEKFADVKAQHGSADVVANDRVVFNIGGNKFRLIVGIDYLRQIIYIKFVGTHSQYDRIDAATVTLD